MADLLSFDTTFLIDLQKERLANRKGGANQFLQRPLPCFSLDNFKQGLLNSPLGNRIMKIILFGSWAKGTAQEERVYV
ncbi:hypothetical protein MYX75_00525 [Acidobacteria bacterium AH-259-A15]|nr:hypothetical protein [Acidobacteria bacterium AH-259-A15]